MARFDVGGSAAVQGPSLTIFSNLRLEKRIPARDGRGFSVFLDVFNLLNWITPPAAGGSVARARLAGPEGGWLPSSSAAE